MNIPRTAVRSVRDRAVKVEILLARLDRANQVGAELAAASARFEAAETAQWAMVQARLAYQLRPVLPPEKPGTASYDLAFEESSDGLGPRGTWYAQIHVDGRVVERLPRPSRLTAMVAAVERLDELRVSPAKAA